MAEYIEREAAKRELVSDYAYAAANLLDKVPAADVVEVRHGRWVVKNGRIVCDQCDAVYAVLVNSEDELLGEDLKFVYKREKFCFNCGAKMDGGADNG